MPRFLHWSLLLSLTLVPMGTVLADEEQVEEVAEGAAEGEHGEHGPLSLHSIMNGEESLQFWGSVVNFALLVFLIRRLSKKPLTSFLSERRASVETGIAEAAAMKAKAEAIWKEYNERMQTLDAELAKLRADMSAAAELDKARIVAEAQESSVRLRAETAALIARQAEQLEAQIRHEVVEAAVAAAERAVREGATADDQRRLADAFARELATVTTGPGKEKRA